MATVTFSTPITTGVSTDTADVAERLLRSVVFVRSGWGNGSGVIWDADGLIVTNSHVVRGNDATVILRDGTRFPATVVTRDPRRDLAALRVAATNLPAARIGDSARVHVGQVVLAVGNPLGMQGVVTAGIVTGAGQVTGDGRTRLDDLIQADVALAPGNSGGPLADAEGRVLGINTMISGAGIALAIPAAVVQAFLSPMRGSRPYLGINGLAVQVRAAGKERGALLLTAVEEGSPADRAGLLQGDVLLEWDDHAVETGDEFQIRLGNWQAGQAVRLLVLRAIEPRLFTFKPAEQTAA